MSKKRMIDILITAGLVYGAVLAFLYFNQRNMMYFPDAGPIDPAGGQVVQVKTQDGFSVKGLYFPPAEDKPVMLYFHGNAGHHGYRVDNVSDYRDNGYGVLLAGYRGYGGNPGQPTEAGLYMDARAYTGWLQEQRQKIVLYGESLGSGVAVQMAIEFDVEAVILEAPYTSTADVAQSIYFYVPVALLMKDQFRSSDKIQKVKAPLLIIHGERDRTIPIHFGRDLFQAANEPKRFIALPYGGHDDLYDHGAALHVLEFLGTLSKQ